MYVCSTPSRIILMSADAIATPNPTHHPDSAFTVLEANWAEDLKDYHHVTIEAANDNRLVPEDVPLAPWF